MQKNTGTLSLIEWARELGSEYPFFDFHVHPYDVLAGDTAYQANNQVEGVYSRGAFTYKAPSIENKIREMDEGAAPPKLLDSERALLLGSRFLYSHTGPKVLTDQMDLVGLTNALLLPVARAPGVVNEMVDAAKNMFLNDDRFLLGCPVPVGMKRDEIASFFRSARDKWGIRAIKVHPNLADMDPLSTTGKELIEATLEIAGELKLPVVVHGGRTPGLKQKEQREFGLLARLKELDWSISSTAVIIAHAGCYTLDENEARDALSILEKMLEKHSNLYADTSNLETAVLGLVMETVDRKRLIFGSDAFYDPIWKAWVNFLQVLCKISPDSESDLVQIASDNPARCLASIS